MDNALSNLVHQSWALLLMVLAPSLAIPLAGALFSVFLGLLGIRDEGLSYALRVVVFVGLGMFLLSAVGEGLVSLMTLALQ